MAVLLKPFVHSVTKVLTPPPFLGFSQAYFQIVIYAFCINAQLLNKSIFITLSISYKKDCYR